MQEKESAMRGDRTARKSICPNCHETVIVIRHPADALKSVKELPTNKIRCLATHLKDAGEDFAEASTTHSEFNALVSTIICEKRIKPWEVLTP